MAGESNVRSAVIANIFYFHISMFLRFKSIAGFDSLCSCLVKISHCWRVRSTACPQTDRDTVARRPLAGTHVVENSSRQAKTRRRGPEETATCCVYDYFIVADNICQESLFSRSPDSPANFPTILRSPASLHTRGRSSLTLAASSRSLRPAPLTLPSTSFSPHFFSLSPRVLSADTFNGRIKKPNERRPKNSMQRKMETKTLSEVVCECTFRSFS